jgi:hypothetical protein
MIGQSVADYGMKLESILQKVYDTGMLNPKVKNDMLRAKFWSGLRDPALKNAIRYKYDIIKNFDELRKEVRAEIYFYVNLYYNFHSYLNLVVYFDHQVVYFL